VTKEFALDKARTDRSAVDFHQWTPVTSAAIMNGAGDEFFAGACLALNEYRSFRRRHLIYLLKHGEQRAAITHYLDKVVLTADFLLKINVLGFQLCLFFLHQHAIGDIKEHCSRVVAAGIGLGPPLDPKRFAVVLAAHFEHHAAGVGPAPD
jgi:hypothetical protein